MIMMTFKTKGDKEHLLEKAKKMEEYAAMIVDCIEESEHFEDKSYYERNYRHEMPSYEDKYEGRYGYRNRMR